MNAWMCLLQSVVPARPVPGAVGLPLGPRLWAVLRSRRVRAPSHPSLCSLKSWLPPGGLAAQGELPPVSIRCPAAPAQARRCVSGWLAALAGGSAQSRSPAAASWAAGVVLQRRRARLLLLAEAGAPGRTGESPPSPSKRVQVAERAQLTPAEKVAMIISPLLLSAAAAFSASSRHKAAACPALACRSRARRRAGRAAEHLQ